MTTPLDPLRNVRDPLHAANAENAKALFRQFSQLSDGFPVQVVIVACLNTLANAVRTANATWDKAETSINEKFYQAKSLLRDHYDANGKRRNVFPFDQTILMRFHTDRDKTPGQ